MTRNQFRIRIEQDRRTGEWLVLERGREIGRHTDPNDAHDQAQREVA